MPVYGFVCKDCGNKFEELFLKMSDRDSDVECPSCKGENVEKVMSVSVLGLSEESDSPSCCCCSE